MLHLAGRTEDAGSNRQNSKGRQMQRRLSVGWSIGSGLADVEAPTNAGSERVKTGNEANKKRAAIFLGCSFLCLRVVCGTEAFSADWNSPAEQRERPEGDRLFASL